MTNDKTPLTPAEIAEVRRLEAAATKGPQWDYVANAKYIHALRNSAPRLLAAAERDGQQSARIATLEKLVREAMPTMTAAKSDIEAYTAYFKRPEPELDFVTRWLSAAREAVGEGVK